MFQHLTTQRLSAAELERRRFNTYTGLGVPGIYQILMSEWANMSSIHESQSVLFQLVGKGFAVPFPVVITGSERYWEENGRCRLLRGYFAGRYQGNPKGRPTKQEAEVIVAEYDLQTGQGVFLVTNWLAEWIEATHAAIVEDNRYRPDF